MIKFEIGGRTVDPNNVGDALMAEMLKSIRAQLTENIGSIRDPETGEFPTVIVRGDDLENLTLKVEGSPELIVLVKTRLGLENEEAEETVEPDKSPIVFLSYASEDLILAENIANILNENGIEVWWDQWCISTGDSLRQKIEEGLLSCTHFLVLLTPHSIKKPWVNQEMDAGLVRKIEEKCKFLPVRSGLEPRLLPPLLAGMLAPKVITDADILQLINDIHGVTRKPPMGTTPETVKESAETNTGYSPAANALAKYFVENSEHGLFADPIIEVGDLAAEIGLSKEDTEDALFELSNFFKISHGSRSKTVYALGALFAEFDQYWMEWDPSQDALKLGADIMNDPSYQVTPEAMAERLGWEPRRLNSAINYLIDRNLIKIYKTLNSRPYVTIRLTKSDHLRRFVKSRA